MKSDDFSEGNTLTLMEAVEALSSVTEENSTEEPQIGDGPAWRDASWIQDDDKEKVVSTVKEIFRVIFNHIKNVYQDGQTLISNQRNLEGIKSLMILVGEAAKKIDRQLKYTRGEGAESVTELREYKQLQEFYQRKISRTIDEALLGKWILAIAQETFWKKGERPLNQVEEVKTSHVFVDFDSVKNDTEYELLFIRKENGTRFFNPRLIRNIMLVSDFGTNLAEIKEKDPLLELPLYTDQIYQKLATSILEKIDEPFRKYSMSKKEKEFEFPSFMNMAMIALFSAANKVHLISNGSSKGCADYFADFQTFLRAAISSREFEQWQAFSSSGLTPYALASMQLVGAILKVLYSNNAPLKAIISMIHALEIEGQLLLSSEHKKQAELSNMIWSHLGADFAALQKIMKKHPYGPLNKALSLFDYGSQLVYNPYLQRQLPSHAFSIYEEDRKVDLHVLPSPTMQEFIHEARLDKEFLTFLRNQQDEKILIINYQDRTSWKEHARSSAIELLTEGTDLSGAVDVATIPKDTEFYLQEAPYNEDHQIDKFKHHLISHVLDESCGFYFSERVKEKIGREFAESLFEAIHRIYFSSRNVLTKDARLAFIDLYQLILELKIIDCTKSSGVYLCCKDGVDISSLSSAAIYLFLKFLTPEGVNVAELAQVKELLFARAILLRERTPQSQRMHRLIALLRVIEQARVDFGANAYIKIVKEALSRHLSFEMLTAIPSFQE